MALALVAFSSYSYSEIITGVTPNAAGNGLNWSMDNVLPQESGLIVNGVIYKYTAMKEQQDQMLVNIQNQNALGTGYVFKSQDDWSGVPGNTITKAVPVENIPIQYWGNGEIEVEGKGNVVDPTVTYTYRYDTCYDPISDPSCPGYAAAMGKFLADNLPPTEIKIFDPLEDENIVNSINRKVELDDDEKKKQQAEKEKEEGKKKIALRESQNALNAAVTVSQEAILDIMNNATDINSYYSIALNGGAYADATAYMSAKVPENKQALRNGFAQQLLHKKLIESQYDLGRN